MQLEITNQRNNDLQAISLEVYQKRRMARRKRVAKRLYKKSPVLVLELMSAEFPGYTWADLEQDVFAKKPKRKNKSFRHTKKLGFDWRYIYRQVPGFFYKCTQRTPTKAVLYIELQGRQFKVTINSVYYHGEIAGGRNIFDTASLVNILKTGKLKTLLTHPAVLVEDVRQDINNT